MFFFQPENGACVKYVKPFARVVMCLALPLAATTEGSEQSVAIPAARRAVIVTAHHAVEEAGVPANATSTRNGDSVRLFNSRVCVTLNTRDHHWDVVWLRDAKAAIVRAGVIVVANRQLIPPAGVKTEVTRATDRLGAGIRLTSTWGEAVQVQHRIVVHDDSPALIVAACIKNTTAQNVTLEDVSLVDVSPEHEGWWYVGDVSAAPAAVFLGGASDLLCRPASVGPAEEAYSSSGILALTDRGRTAGLSIGYLTAREARPDLAAQFRIAEGGTELKASSRFLGRTLAAGQSLELDPVYLSAHCDPYEALERYGDAAAASAEQPVRKGPNSLWCSWYAHRMAMSEDLVLANAAVAARYFKPLGLNVIQLDHGWQRGDVTGDWVPNERFPHGLKWLCDELQSRHQMRLGVWIAPTDVAETSETFKRHPDWMLKGQDGKPLVNWKWYWKPNPNCYEVDVSNPAAANWMGEVFANLSASGVEYFKIDFLYACGGEQFHQSDPYCTRGWSVLRKAMESIRRGAGAKAWIRYCQAPPLLAAGLADSNYGGCDTLDAGLGGNIEVLRTNARSLAASYWINNRLYNREVCDMSVRMQADIEEVRLRLAMMTLAGCSISFSDELQYLPASRIKMMQQCLPPGSPAMRPLDLFERRIPSVWHIPCRQGSDEWHIVGLFNFENEPQERTVTWAQLGLPADSEAVVFEFWDAQLVGCMRKAATLVLPPQSSRILSIRRNTGRPQVIGTDMHLLQGWHELRDVKWAEQALTLSGRCHRANALCGRLFVLVPEGFEPRFDFPLNQASAHLTHVRGPLWVHEISFENADVEWSVPFRATREATTSPGL